MAKFVSSKKHLFSIFRAFFTLAGSFSRSPATAACRRLPSTTRIGYHDWGGDVKKKVW
jgi:hypothetical protein